MSEVLLGQSYYLRFDPKLWEAMQPYPPLGTLYAASYLRSRGYDVALFDAMLAESEAEWDAALDRERPRFAVLYEDNFNYLSKMCLLRMREAAFVMIRAARERGCTVIVAGSDATDHAGRYLLAGADFVLLGEGEYTLAELLDHLTGRSDQPLEGILGLAYPDPTQPDGVKRTPRRPDIRDLDALPFPAWDLVDVPRYRDIWLRRHGYFSMNMVTTRGCPFHCNWCAKPIWGQRYNARSPENVAAELKWLRDNYQPDHIWFVDDIMGLKPGWLQRYADEVERLGVRTPFKSLHRVDLLLRGDTIEALARAGAQIVWVGAESGSQRILDAMRRRTKAERVREMVHLLQRHGIEAGMFIMLGYEGEEMPDLEATVEHLKESNPDVFLTTVAYPIKNTPYYEMVKDRIIPLRPWDEGSDRDFTVAGRHSRRFYQFATRWMVNEVAAHRERQQAQPDYRRLAKAMVNARIGRLGMLATQHEVERGQ